jgi:hypothetical protein
VAGQSRHPRHAGLKWRTGFTQSRAINSGEVLISSGSMEETNSKIDTL